MRPGETVRFACDECRMAFDITIAPPAEWWEPQDDMDYRLLPSRFSDELGDFWLRVRECLESLLVRLHLR